jgi:transcription elongation factor
VNDHVSVEFLHSTRSNRYSTLLRLQRGHLGLGAKSRENRCSDSIARISNQKLRILSNTVQNDSTIWSRELNIKLDRALSISKHNTEWQILSLDQVNSTRRSRLRGIYRRDISIAASPSRERVGSIPQEDDVVDITQGEGVCACDLGEDVADVVQAEELGWECLAASVDRQICYVVQIQSTTYRGGRIVNRSY